MNCRDTYGFLTNMPGESPADGCPVRGCCQPATEQRASQTTDRWFCERHAAMWDTGLVTGSILTGYSEVRE